MSDNDSSGTNWLLGLDKLTAPTLDFLGLRIRDKIRAYLSSNARERAALRAFEREFLSRQIDLLNYGADQFALIIETWEESFLELQLSRFRDSLRALVESRNLEPDHLLSVLSKGIAHKDTEGLSPDDLLAYNIAASIVDCLVASHALKIIFHLVLVPAIVHRQDPEVSDDELQRLLDSEETNNRVASEVRRLDHDIGDKTAAIVAEIYGIPWSENDRKAEPGATDNPDDA